ncbi:YjbQ family protein, partial [bacterium]|nr:YjbQ family protein [bacterium]
NGYAHVRASIVGNSTHIPLIDGVLHMGQWQQVVLIDFDNKARARQVNVQIMY